MADLKTNFLGIESPNPFWLASAPPTDKAYNVNRAFEAGWGGAVWKTLGEAGPPICNVAVVQLEDPTQLDSMRALLQSRVSGIEAVDPFE